MDAAGGAGRRRQRRRKSSSGPPPEVPPQIEALSVDGIASPKFGDVLKAREAGIVDVLNRKALYNATPPSARELLRVKMAALTEQLAGLERTAPWLFARPVNFLRPDGRFRNLGEALYVMHTVVHATSGGKSNWVKDMYTEVQGSAEMLGAFVDIFDVPVFTADKQERFLELGRLHERAGQVVWTVGSTAIPVTQDVHSRLPAGHFRKIAAFWRAKQTGGSETLVQRVRRMAPGESVFVMVSFSFADRDGGHANMARIAAHNDGRFSLYVFEPHGKRRRQEGSFYGAMSGIMAHAVHRFNRWMGRQGLQMHLDGRFCPKLQEKLPFCVVHSLHWTLLDHKLRTEKLVGAHEDVEAMRQQAIEAVCTSSVGGPRARAANVGADLSRKSLAKATALATSAPHLLAWMRTALLVSQGRGTAKEARMGQLTCEWDVYLLILALNTSVYC